MFEFARAPAADGRGGDAAEAEPGERVFDEEEADEEEGEAPAADFVSEAAAEADFPAFDATEAAGVALEESFASAPTFTTMLAVSLMRLLSLLS